MVTIENYEEYFMLAADGELDTEGRKALGVFLAAHPELAAEAEAWKFLRLTPDVHIVYADKETLLRKEPKQIVVNWQVSLAAGAAPLLAAIPIPRLGQHKPPPFPSRMAHPACI